MSDYNIPDDLQERLRRIHQAADEPEATAINTREPPIEIEDDAPDEVASNQEQKPLAHATIEQLEEEDTGELYWRLVDIQCYRRPYPCSVIYNGVRHG